LLSYVTGEQVLERLKFRGTVRGNLFGLGMVLIGFTFCAYVALFFSAIKYMSLGHIGGKQKNQKLDVMDIIPAGGAPDLIPESQEAAATDIKMA
jgi:hypothetical protein